jgi:hypothetical protein
LYQVESDLANARFEVDSLKQKVESLLNHKQRLLHASSSSSLSSSSSFVCPKCQGKGRDPVAKETDLDAALLRQELKDKSRLLQEEESRRLQCECELLEVKAKLSNAEAELRERGGSEVKERGEVKVKKERRSSVLLLSSAASEKPAVLLSGSDKRDAYDILHSELEKVRIVYIAGRHRIILLSQYRDTMKPVK